MKAGGGWLGGTMGGTVGNNVAEGEKDMGGKPVASQN